MSDYSYCIVHVAPPRPKITFQLWLRSWFGPIYGWTVGRAYSPSKGVTDARSKWAVHRGKARLTSRSGMVHTCGTPSTCECNTDRQIEGEATND